MKELKEIRFNSDILLQDNLVKSAILPQKAAELTRNIEFRGNTIVEGAVYGQRIQVKAGNIEVQGAVFAQQELFVNSEVEGKIEFKKSVASADSIVSRAAKCDMTFYSDVNAKTVTLYNAFVAGSIYADEVTLENCVVIGGVFATQQADITNSIIGTFNSPSIRIAGIVQLLLPSAFSIEKMVCAPGTVLYNLSLADLGSLYKGLPQAENSGRIEMNVEVDELRSRLVGEDTQHTLRSYTVVGKVLAADLLDTDKFQNHFLLTAASLGPQLLKTYDLGFDKDGNNAYLTIENIRKFFFDIQSGRIEVKPMSGTFNINDLAQ